MKRHVRILLTSIAVVLATLGFTLALSSTHSPLVDEHAVPAVHGDHEQTNHGHDHHAAVTAPRSHSGASAHQDHNNGHNGARALSDIHAHAQRHLGHFTPRLETFGGTHEWSHEFDLYWLDVEHDGNVVRIYHATDSQHPHNRFIWMAHDGTSHPAAWEEVH